MKTANQLVVLFSLTVAWAIPVSAQASGEQMDQILKELREIRRLIESTSQPSGARPVRIQVRGAPVLGSKDAAVTIAAFTDFQCPFCEQFYQKTFPLLKRSYVDRGTVRFYIMDFPLGKIHPNAMLAAQGGRCAAEQMNFWPMYDHMQASPNELDMLHLTTYAEQVGLDGVSFRQCLESRKYEKEIQQSVEYATSKGITGTPAFVIGRSTPDGVDGELVVGAVPYEVLEQVLRKFM